MYRYGWTGGARRTPGVLRSIGVFWAKGRFSQQIVSGTVVLPASHQRHRGLLAAIEAHMCFMVSQLVVEHGGCSSSVTQNEAWELHGAPGPE